VQSLLVSYFHFSTQIETVSGINEGAILSQILDQKKRKLVESRPAMVLLAEEWIPPALRHFCLRNRHMHGETYHSTLSNDPNSILVGSILRE